MLVGNEQLALCVDCYLKLVQATAIQQDTLGRTLNMLHAQMEFALPMPMRLPRYRTREHPIIGDLVLNNIKIDRSTIGVLNTGVVTNLDSAVTVLNQQGQSELGKAIAQFTEQLAGSGLSPTNKEKVAELLSALSTEAIAPKSNQKKAVVPPLLSEISGLIQGAAGLVQLWAPLQHLFTAVFS